MNDDTLIYTQNKIEKLAGDIQGHLNEFENAINDMFYVIDMQMNQPGHWSGKVYDEFKTKCDHFRSAEIETMAKSLKAYVSHFTKTASEAGTTTTKNIGYINNIN